MFLRDYWYVAALPEEVGDAPFARRILDEPVVFYRTPDGAVVALEDRCCHRRAPLSQGQVIGDRLQCGYHGLEFGPTGACVAIPGQSRVPDDAHVRLYPTVERLRYIWIWMGDPAEADESEIPGHLYHTNDDPEWAPVGGYLHMEGNWWLLAENLLDLSHITYLHAKTIGMDNVAASPVDKTERGDDGVTVSRWMPDCELPPIYRPYYQPGERVDRWQKTRFEPPSHCTLSIGTASIGAVDQGGERVSDKGTRLNQRVLNAITPETKNSLHYFWGFPRDWSLDDRAIDEVLHDGIRKTLIEDIVMIEGQQQIIDDDPRARQIDINADTGGIAARRLIDKLLREEAARRGEVAAE